MTNQTEFARICEALENGSSIRETALRNHVPVEVVEAAFKAMSGQGPTNYLPLERASRLPPEPKPEPGTMSRMRAALCWRESTTSHIVMEPALAEAFARVLDEYVYALLWCSSSDDFQPGGRASAGWERVCAPLLRKPGHMVMPTEKSARSSEPF